MWDRTPGHKWDIQAMRLKKGGTDSRTVRTVGEWDDRPGRAGAKSVKDACSGDKAIGQCVVGHGCGRGRPDQGPGDIFKEED